MALDKIILVANPGSASRKYAVYKGAKKLLSIHFEYEKNKVVYSTSNHPYSRPAGLVHLTFSATKLPDIIAKELDESIIETLNLIMLRVVAPSSFFQRNHVLTKAVLKRLERLESTAPLHIGATLAEHKILEKTFQKVKFVGVSDSSFLSEKPNRAMYYGIPLHDANKLDIKRFGYHGLSFESAVNQLKSNKLLSKRIVICHLGGGCSVAAVENGRIIDSTMGFSPIEGLVMATRSGTVDMLAYESIKRSKHLTNQNLHDYFNMQSGLLGLSGTSSDVRDLLEQEESDSRAKLALEIFVYKIQQAIGAMSAAMGGVDAVVFAGTIGERSHKIRQRIAANLMYLGLIIDHAANSKVFSPELPVVVSKSNHAGKIIVLHSQENSQMIKQAKNV
ncbi:acetate/propionate family kinase [Candidatus Saccharibacteria bacterium]|nr:acetate/propionate family kinase [Candidatus Saccharibacteria bacterium]